MEQVETKIDAALQESEYDALLAFGPDNFSYLTQSVLPFAEHYPDRKAVVLLLQDEVPCVVAPIDWAEAIGDQTDRVRMNVYDEGRGDPSQTVVHSIARELTQRGLERGRLGIDAERVSKDIMDSLRASLPRVNWRPADSLINALRVVKCAAEVACIETACKQADRAIVYALMHLEGTLGSVGYTVAEFSERIRVHVNENGGSGVGLLATVLGGASRAYYAPQLGGFERDTMFRMDLSSHHSGYWANVGRMGFTGEPEAQQADAYRNNRALKEIALERLRPGVVCRDLHAHVVSAADRMGIDIWPEAGIGHGVGASHHEEPYLSARGSTELSAGMVVALDILSRAPDGALIHDKDVYTLTEHGHRKLSWYRDWDRLYAVTGFRATH